MKHLTSQICLEPAVFPHRVTVVTFKSFLRVVIDSGEFLEVTIKPRGEAHTSHSKRAVKFAALCLKISHYFRIF